MAEPALSLSIVAIATALQKILCLYIQRTKVTSAELSTEK